LVIYKGAFGQPRWTTSPCDPLVRKLNIGRASESFPM
jgi:hypothetical protein